MFKHDDNVLYDSVLEYAKVNSKISAKSIMWRFQIDNNRASKTYERLEKDGIVNDRGEVLNTKLEL
jgi:predicted HTH transcriptional regulator